MEASVPAAAAAAAAHRAFQKIIKRAVHAPCARPANGSEKEGCNGWRWPDAAAVVAGALSVSRIAGLSLLLAQDQQGKSALLGP